MVPEQTTPMVLVWAASGVSAVWMLRRVRNPRALLRDRCGLQAAPYEVRLRSGPRLELRPGRGDRTAASKLPRAISTLPNCS